MEGKNCLGHKGSRKSSGKCHNLRTKIRYHDVNTKWWYLPDNIIMCVALFWHHCSLLQMLHQKLTWSFGILFSIYYSVLQQYCTLLVQGISAMVWKGVNSLASLFFKIGRYTVLFQVLDHNLLLNVFLENCHQSNYLFSGSLVRISSVPAALQLENCFIVSCNSLSNKANS